MNLLDVEIITSRLLLKPIAWEYKEEIFSEFTEEITIYMYPRPARTMAETESFIKESLEGLRKGINLTFVILVKESKEFLGCTGLHQLDKKPTLGIWLKQAAHGNKYGLEAITGIKEWVDTNLDCEYLSYSVDKRNIASRKIPELLGGKVVREYADINQMGKVLHLVEYRFYKQ